MFIDYGSRIMTKFLKNIITVFILVQWSLQPIYGQTREAIAATIPSQNTNSQDSGDSNKATTSYNLSNTSYDPVRGWSVDVETKDSKFQVQIPRASQSELENSKPSVVKNRLQTWYESEKKRIDLEEKHHQIVESRKTLLSRTAVRFPGESFMFFLAIGAVTAGQTYLDSAKNPLAMIQHLESQADPLTHFSFFAFMTASGYYSEPLQILYGKTAFRHFIPYIGMSAGMVASNIVHEIGAIAPGTIACGKARLAKDPNMDQICDEAFAQWILQEKLHQYAPMFMSLFFSNFISGLVHGTPGVAAKGTLYVAQKLGITKSIQKTAQAMAVVTVIGFNAVIGSKVKWGAKAASGVVRFLAPGFLTLVRDGSRVAQFSLFTGIDQLTINYINLLYSNQRHGIAFNQISESLLRSIDKESKSGWSAKSKVLENLKEMNERFEKWEEAKASEINLANDLWTAKVSNATATYFASQKIYGSMIDDLANSQKDPLYRSYTLDSVYPLNGIIPDVYRSEAKSNDLEQVGTSQRYLTDLVFNPANLRTLQIQQMVNVARQIDEILNPNPVSHDELLEQKKVIYELKRLIKQLQSDDPKMVLRGTDALESFVRTRSLSLEQKNMLYIALSKLREIDVTQFFDLVDGSNKSKFRSAANKLDLSRKISLTLSKFHSVANDLERSLTVSLTLDKQPPDRAQARLRLKMISDRLKSGNPQIVAQGIQMLKGFQGDLLLSSFSLESRNKIIQLVDSVKTHVPLNIPGYGYLHYRGLLPQLTKDLQGITAMGPAIRMGYRGNLPLEGITSALYTGESDFSNTLYNSYIGDYDIGTYGSFTPPKLIKDSILIEDGANPPPGIATATFSNMWTDLRLVYDNEAKAYKYNRKPVNLWTIITDQTNYRSEIVEVINKTSSTDPAQDNENERGPFLEWWTNKIEPAFYSKWLSFEDTFHTINIRRLGLLLNSTQAFDDSAFAKFDQSTRNTINNWNPSSIENGILGSYLQQLKTNLLVINELARSSVQTDNQELPAELMPIESFNEAPLNLQTADLLEILRSTSSLDFESIKAQYNLITKGCSGSYSFSGTGGYCMTKIENRASLGPIQGHISSLQQETLQSFNEVSALFKNMKTELLKRPDGSKKEIVVFNVDRESANKIVQKYEDKIKKWENLLSVSDGLNHESDVYILDFTQKSKTHEGDTSTSTNLSLTDDQKEVAKEAIKSMKSIAARVKRHLSAIDIISFRVMNESGEATQRSCSGEKKIWIGGVYRENPNCVPGTINE